jgi:hypothetical protein
MSARLRRSLRAISLAGLATLSPAFGVGCVFQRDWRASQCCPTVAEGIEGPWEGRWKSEKSGREGKLKAVVTRTGDASYTVQFHSTKLGVVPSNLDVPLQVSFRDQQYVFSGEVDRGTLAGGTFRYDGYANRGHFHATYETDRDEGVFELARVGPTVDCSPCDEEFHEPTASHGEIHAAAETARPRDEQVMTAGHTVPDAAPGPDKAPEVATPEKRRWRFPRPWRRTPEQKPSDDSSQ